MKCPSSLTICEVRGTVEIALAPFCFIECTVIKYGDRNMKKNNKLKLFLGSIRRAQKREIKIDRQRPWEYGKYM